MQQYLDLMRRVRNNGVKKTDRTGTGTLSVFGHQMRFDLADGFPLVTTKKLHVRSIIHELIWFLRGDKDLRYLKDHDVKIWDEWAREEWLYVRDDPNLCPAGKIGPRQSLGPIYGHQWRSWHGPDGQ